MNENNSTRIDLTAEVNMIENILNTFDITNIIWIAIGAFLQFVISKIFNKLKKVFLCDEKKL